MVYESTTCSMCGGYTYDSESDKCVGCGSSPVNRRIYSTFSENARLIKGVGYALAAVVFISSGAIKFGGREQAPENLTADRSGAQRASLRPSDESTGNRRRIEPRPISPPPSILALDKLPTPYSIPKSTWGAHFNPENSVPDNGFRAFYFDSSDPDQLVHTEHVEKIYIDYSWSKFHDISSQSFGAYWVGSISTDEEAVFEVIADKGHNEFRVIIDGSIVQDYNALERNRASDPPALLKTSKVQYGVNDTPVKKVVEQQASAKPAPKRSKGNPRVTLLPGDHLVEIELLNHWHTTDFSAVFKRIR